MQLFCFVRMCGAFFHHRAEPYLFRACSTANFGPCNDRHADICIYARTRRTVQSIGHRRRWVCSCADASRPPTRPLLAPHLSASTARRCYSTCTTPLGQQCTPCLFTMSPSMCAPCRYVRGEACITLGLSVHGIAVGTSSRVDSSPTPSTVVLGGAINQDGRSSSLTAPNGPSQQQASKQRACMVHTMSRCTVT